MIRIVKKVLLSFILFFSFFLISQVQANSIQQIDMDVYIDSNGNASITEIWQANLTQGTEGFRPYTNLGNSSVSNFSVSDDSGRTYETLSYWNTSATFENKAYKCGLHNISNGVELCWGISNYGNRSYILKYNISNFVTQYTDTQGIYFNFLNLDQPISGNAKITIHSDIQFSLDNSKIWAFGNNGSINFNNGSIVLDSGGRLSSSQYMVGLVRFENNLFNTSYTSSQSFNDIYDSAFSTVEDDNNLSFNSILFTPMLFILVIIPIMLLIMIILKNCGSTSSTQYKNDFDFGVNGLVLPNDNNVNYFREIPCNKDLERAYWVCYYFDIIPISTLYQGIIGAIFLKWIKNGYIRLTKTKARFI